LEQHWIQRGENRNASLWPLEEMIWKSLIDIAMGVSTSVEDGTVGMVNKMKSFALDSSAIRWYKITGKLITM
jgi:hypothetical protein